ncbi:hypothetical protein HPULCUR_006838 [Helicostylum pulchrum]|uniref:Uncharacterized protein n=1 Tax=Helicostylum pulchrum TaxID=562976 RepID=A0ABP9Y335_9FUNG
MSYSAKGLHLPEIKNMLEGAGEYLVIKLDIGEGEAKRLMKDVDGVSATLFGYRERSASDLNIENAAKFFFLSLSISVIRMIIKTALGLFKSPLSQLF